MRLLGGREAIALHGKLAVLGKHFFMYKWQKKYPEFLNAVAQTKEEFRRNCPDELKRQARKSLAEYLFNGAIETWESTETIEDASGKVKLIKRSIKTVKRGTPQWAIDQVLGQPMSELESIKSLTKSGWLQQQVLERLGMAMDKFNESAKAAFQGNLDEEDLDAQSGG